MFDDLKGIAPADLQEKIKQLKDALRQSRDWMIDKQNECDVLKNLYNESYQDNQKLAKHIKNLHDRIVEKDLIDDFADLEVPEQL